MRYDGFLSYSHGADRPRAVAVQRALHTLAKPFYRWKALDIFRDETSLAANPKLWSSIERALDASRFFILFACPQSASSAWCAREVAWWLAHRSSDSLLIVLTEGELAYDEAAGDFDWARTNSLPAALKGKFPIEPLYRDLRWASRPEQLALSDPRFRDAVLPLAAALHGKEPQELDGDDLRQFRRARLFWRSAAAGLAVLALTSAIAAWVANRKSEEAERERAIAVARQLAAEAEATRMAGSALLPRSVLLAVEAARRMRAHDVVSAQLDRTLRETLALLPRPAVNLSHAKVATFAVSADGQRAVSVGFDGSIGVWNLDTHQDIDRLITDREISKIAIAPNLELVAIGATRELLVVHVPDRRIVARKTLKGTVTALAFNPDGTLLAAGNTDKEAIVFKLPGAEQVARFVHGEAVEDVAFSADSRLLATGTGSVAARLQRRPSTDDAAHVWEIASARRIARMPHPHVVEAVAFNPDARVLATGSLDGYARSWDIETQQELARSAHPDGVQHVRFSPDGRHVASASRPYLVGTRDQTVQVWETATGREIGRMSHERGLRSIAFSPDGRWVASAGADRTARLFEYSGREAMRIALDAEPSSVGFTPDSRRLLVGGPGLLLVPVAEGFGPRRSQIPSLVTRAALAPDGTSVAVIEGGNAASVWEIGANEPRYRVEHSALVVAIAFSDDGRWLATGSQDRSARIWRADSGAPHVRLDHGEQVTSVAFSPDGRAVATASADKTTRVWEVDSGSEVLRLDHDSAVTVLRYIDGGRLLATGTESGHVRVWDPASGRMLMEGKLDADVQLLAASADGRRLAAATNHRVVHMWNPRTGAELARLTHESNVRAIVFSPDGRLVSSTWDGSLRVWTANAGAVQWQLKLKSVSSLAFSHDGRFLASADDRVARVFRFADMSEAAALIHPIEVNAAAFTPDDQFLFAWSGDFLSVPHAVRLWPWRLDSLVAEACARSSRNLTLEEWRQHLRTEPYRRTCPERPTHPSVLAPALEQARAAALAGRSRDARGLYRSLSLDADNTDDASVANQICWSGALDGAVRDVFPLCERAVRLAPDDGRVRDTRGLARALIGDKEGASEDFSAFVAWARKAQPESPLIAKREQWLAALREGRNPFDAKLLAALRSDE
jgi:WD40 repeat protein